MLSILSLKLRGTRHQQTETSPHLQRVTRDSNRQGARHCVFLSVWRLILGRALYRAICPRTCLFPVCLPASPFVLSSCSEMTRRQQRRERRKTAQTDREGAVVFKFFVLCVPSPLAGKPTDKKPFIYISSFYFSGWNRVAGFNRKATWCVVLNRHAWPANGRAPFGVIALKLFS